MIDALSSLSLELEIPSQLSGGLLLALLMGITLCLFVKSAVILGIFRAAFGHLDLPPAAVNTIVALLLSLVIVAPIARETFARYEASEQTEVAAPNWGNITEPLRGFLQRNAAPDYQERFESLADSQKKSAKASPQTQHQTPLQTSDLNPSESDPTDQAEHLQSEYLRGEVTGALEHRWEVILPAFIATELTEAFQIGFLLLLPFLVIDLLVAASLMAAGILNAQPSTLALPLKLALFVAIDGWSLLFEGLLKSYQ